MKYKGWKISILPARMAQAHKQDKDGKTSITLDCYGETDEEAAEDIKLVIDQMGKFFREKKRGKDNG